MIFSANYFGMDEDAGTLDGERILDRVAAIPFTEWEDMNANEFSDKQNKFKKVVDDPSKPTELLIGEMGDFLRSEEFTKLRFEFANMLYLKTDESIKMRTLLTNYASFYAINFKLSEIFKTVWEEQGYSWDGFLEWVDQVHAPFLKKQHQEKDHSKHTIRRYVHELMNFVLEWTLLERRKVLKICETMKLKNDQRYCLAFHPSQRYIDFQEMGGVKLKDMKMHVNAVGGAWGEDTWAALVKDSCDNEFDNPEDEEASLQDTQAKRSLLIPVNVFTSTHIMRIASLLGQTDDYKKFGVDEETPSGVEDIRSSGIDDIRNSTQRTASSLNLVLSDVSRIVGPEVEANHAEEPNDEIDFEEIGEPEKGSCFIHDEEDETNQEEPEEMVSEEIIDNHEYEETNVNDNETTYRDEDMEFTELEVPEQNSMKVRNISTLEKGDKTFFLCPCGHSSTNKSGASRHKCKKPMNVSFPCQECGQVCRNAGSLKRHMNSKHFSQTASSLEYSSASGSGAALDFTCQECMKVLSSKRNLENHMEKVHKKNAPAETTTEIHHKSVPTVEDTNPTINNEKASESDTRVTCQLCLKVFAHKKSLGNHMGRIHKEKVIIIFISICDCNLIFVCRDLLKWLPVRMSSHLVQSQNQPRVIR